MNIQQIKIEEIIPYDKNPRINDQAVKSLSESIKQFGFQQPLVLDKNKVIIVGHTRYKAAKELCLTELPCQVADQLTEEQVKAYRILDNDNKSTWNYELLKFEIEELQDLGFDLEPFDTNLLQEAITETDKLKEVTDDEFTEEDPENIFIKKGDLLELGGHRVLCGDSTSAEDVAELMQGKKADMCFTDPPYGVSYANKNEFLNNHDKGNINQEPIENDHGTLEETATLVKGAFVNIKANLTEYNSYYITAPQGGDLLMMMMMQESGLPLRHCLIWVKNNHVLGRTDYNYKHEPILYGWTGKHKFYGNGKHKFSTWQINKPNKNDIHPTMKPVELVANAILNSTTVNMLVLDLFLGSGTTLIAADQLDRICYGMEISPKYCQVILDRWCKYREKEGKPIDAKINGEVYKA